MAADSGSLTILIMDPSAAFDTISHTILLKRLASIGTSHTPDTWFTSYLSDSTQVIQVKSHSSSSFSVSGVPQGSVLGPLLFLIYMLPPDHIYKKYNINHHCYADETELYISSQPNFTLPLISLCDCLMKVKSGSPPRFSNSRVIKLKFYLPAQLPH